MNEVLRFIELEGGRGTALPLWEAFLAVLVAFTCSLVIGLTYRSTHRTPGYSQSFVHTITLTSLVTALVMIIIGTNIARAFSLVGAMSIIRFRNAVKETRDVGYVFFGIAAGMAAGTRFYAVAIGITGLICGLMILMEKFDYARPAGMPEAILRVRLPVGSDPQVVLRKTFERLFQTYSLVSVERVKQGMALEAVYSVRQKHEMSSDELLDEISKVNENMKVVYHLGAHADPL